MSLNDSYSAVIDCIDHSAYDKPALSISSRKKKARSIFSGKADDAVSEKVSHEMRRIRSTFVHSDTAGWPQYNRDAFIQRIG